MATTAATKKILVVDDEADIRWSLKEFLVNKELQAQVFTAASGEEALDQLARERIDLVITDIKMPGISGLDLLMEIKNRFPYISVIVMTAFPSSEFKREALLKGGMHFVEKPFDIKMLRAKIIEALRDSGQFKGVLTGISLTDVIQIKCMSGVTSALRVTEGRHQGIIFFKKGEIIHALCDDVEGEEAFYEIIAFEQGQLDTVKVAEMPEQTIFKPYVAMLMEGSRRQDEREKNSAKESKKPRGGGKAGGMEELKNVAFTRTPPAAPVAQAAPAAPASGLFGPPETRPPSMAELPAAFKAINDYKAAAIMKVSGEVLVKDAIRGGLDLGQASAALNGFFGEVGAATSRIGLDACTEVVLGTRSGTLIMGCGGGAKGDPHLVLAVFGADGNQALGRREMRKVVSQLKTATG